MRRSYLVAAAIFVVVVLWLASGALRDDPHGGGASAETDSAAVMTVRASPVAAQSYISDLVIQGRTEAYRTVELKSQIDGYVESVPAEKGAKVKQGELICRLAVEERAARLAEAEALAAQRELELQAATELAEKGYRARTQLASAQSQYDAARAMVAQMQALLSYTEIRAPFDGIIDQRPAEVGDYLLKGNTCATILDLDPYLVVGDVSERNVGQLRVGDRGRARLVDGSMVEGRIRYVAAAAEPETRSFRVELEVPNPEMRLRHGVTAEIRIPVAQKQAHLIPPSALVLNDDGQIGVRIVEDRVARFRPLEILGNDTRGVWVDGLDAEALVIVVGQQFVTDGERVQVQLVAGDGGRQGRS